MVQRGELSKDGNGSPSSNSTTDNPITNSPPKTKTPAPPTASSTPPSGQTVPTTHHIGVAPIYPFGSQLPGYNALLPGKAGADANSQHRPPPGPYTTAQYDTGKHGLPLPPYSAAPLYAPSQAASNTASPSRVGSRNTSGTRDPPPQHHYPAHRHASMHVPTAEHPGYPFRDDHPRAPLVAPAAWGAHREPFAAAPPHRYFESAAYPPATASFPATAKSVETTKKSATAASVGPYRYSDPTLRREAVNRLATGPTCSDNPPRSDAANDIDGREGATSPSQIESSHREEVTTMGCTCKKTKCLKLYCQCFAVQIFCGENCRCLVCRNTPQFDTERKDAIRNILSRNPSAFDTKFSKSLPDKSLPELTHKLGCKCRKSACMKKYCECYAGNVKCSSNCRCVGCKNMPVLGGPPTPPGAPVLTTSHEGTPKKREPFMLDAAHNLAFLKRGSPADKPPVPRRTTSNDTGDVGSMPSLASEGSPSAKKAEEDMTSMPSVQPNTAEKTAVSALLLAAAMTDMKEPEPSATPESLRKPEPEETCETPQKNLLKQFQSPKRKHSEAQPLAESGHPQNVVVGPIRQPAEEASSAESSPSGSSAIDEDSPKREHPGSREDDFTPSNHHKMKRSRIGSLKKGPRNLSREMMGKSPVPKTNGTEDMVMETPKQKKGNARPELTPVSARCIDFRKMHVNETSNPAEATLDPAA